MTGYNRMNQRLAIKPVFTEDKDAPIRYYKCPVCGTEMNSPKRAQQHCGKLPGEK